MLVSHHFKHVYHTSEWYMELILLVVKLSFSKVMYTVNMNVIIGGSSAIK